MARTVTLQTETGIWDTWSSGWTLSKCQLQSPEVVTHYLTVPGRAQGPYDASTRLTLGQPEFGTRQLVLRLECSDETMQERYRMASSLMNSLHGRSVERIVLPPGKGLPGTFLHGRGSVSISVFDPSHCIADVVFTCEPWQYAESETVYTLRFGRDVLQPFVTRGAGMLVSPTVTVDGAGVVFGYPTAVGTTSVHLAPGTYRLSDFILRAGLNQIMVVGDGDGVLRLTWREGSL